MTRSASSAPACAAGITVVPPPITAAPDASSATACSAESGSRYWVIISSSSIRANMRPGDPSAPRIGTKPAKNGTRTADRQLRRAR